LGSLQAVFHKPLQQPRVTSQRVCNKYLSHGAIEDRLFSLRIQGRLYSIASP
jgi:hypothetical protein